MANDIFPTSKTNWTVGGIIIGLMIAGVTGLYTLGTIVEPQIAEEKKAHEEFQKKWASVEDTTPTVKSPAIQTPPAAPPPPATSMPTVTAEQSEAAHEVVAQLTQNDLIRRIDLAKGNFYINEPLWTGFELDIKEKFVHAMSLYRETEYKGLQRVHLLDSRSGKELANYTPLVA
jgi:hypothetical protein